MSPSLGKREAVEVAARPLRELQKAEHDEIAAAQRALRQAERAHNEVIQQSERELRAATSAWPLAAYGHRVLLFEDRISTPEGNRPLTPDLRARLEDPPHGLRHHLTLTIEAAGWSETIRVPHRDEGRVRDLAARIEAAAASAETALEGRRADAQAAEEDIAAAEADRRHVRDASALVHRLGELCAEHEDVLDMAPAISAGHDGVLVATDNRLLFVALRRTLSFPYDEIDSVRVRGRWFGSRLTVSAASGKGVFSGVHHDHASALAELVATRLRPAPLAS